MFSTYIKSTLVNLLPALKLKQNNFLFNSSERFLNIINVKLFSYIKYYNSTHIKSHIMYTPCLMRLKFNTQYNPTKKFTIPSANWKLHPTSHLIIIANFDICMLTPPSFIISKNLISLIIIISILYFIFIFFFFVLPFAYEICSRVHEPHLTICHMPFSILYFYSGKNYYILYIMDISILVSYHIWERNT